MKRFITVMKRVFLNKEKGIDGILVTIGLCIIALVLCIVMKDSLAELIKNITGSMSQKAQDILTGAGVTIVRLRGILL
ncbi:MAG: hypothetical protein IJ796_06630 [Lachnospiraceae bacterium]|nr:hypothetical protein [Lachnospiraceae bacterium]